MAFGLEHLHILRFQYWSGVVLGCFALFLTLVPKDSFSKNIFQCPSP